MVETTQGAEAALIAVFFAALDDSCADALEERPRERVPLRVRLQTYVFSNSE